jgi:hypothetical protein
MDRRSSSGQAGFADWLMSEKLAQFPNLLIAFSEGQAGWASFLLERLERLESALERSIRFESSLRERVSESPSSYLLGRVFLCVFDDLHRLRSRDVIGIDQFMYRD